MNLSNKILSDITVYMKYAKYIPETKRRETWDQLVVGRNESMHIKKFPNLKEEIRAAYEDVYSIKHITIYAKLYSSAESQLRYLLTGFITVLTYQLNP